MTLSRNDIEILLTAGIEIVGDLLRVEDMKNKVTYEFPLSEVGQLSLKKRFRFAFRKKTKHELVVHKWDMTSLQFDVPEIEQDQDLKLALKNVNTYFYTAS